MYLVQRLMSTEKEASENNESPDWESIMFSDLAPAFVLTGASRQRSLSRVPLSSAVILHSPLILYVHVHEIRQEKVELLHPD
jgi:hypothetical protein